jgi:hypothetical protein
MNATLDRLTPGHLPTVCPGCRHYLATMPEHANPCDCVKWHGQRHYKPAISSDGDDVACSDFAPNPEPLEAAT